MEHPVKIRWIEQTDLDEFLHIEEEASAVSDPDFGVDTWAWRRNDFLDAIRQRKNDSEGTADTRTCVVDIKLKDEDDEWAWTCAGFIYELRRDGYELVKLTVHPEAPIEILDEVVAYLKTKAASSEKRNKVYAWIRDGDYHYLPAFQSEGFEVKLVPGHFGPTDAWLCTWEAESREEVDVKSDAV